MKFVCTIGWDRVEAIEALAAAGADLHARTPLGELVSATPRRNTSPAAGCPLAGDFKQSIVLCITNLTLDMPFI